VTPPRIGWALSGLAVAFLLFDALVKFSGIQPVTDSFAQLGYPLELAGAIGALELACVALYAVPRTAVLGAVLLTGLFGGAIATHLRVMNPPFSHTLFSLYLAAFVWGGLTLREPRLRALLPLRR
jgi:uncharacterized YccA/Bax inhibitor family protein